MKKITQLTGLLFGLFLSLSINAQTTFGWDTNPTDNGDNVTETINGITTTFTGPTMDTTMLYVNGWGGSSGNIVVISPDGSLKGAEMYFSEVTFSFSEPVNVISILALESYQDDIDYIFTPTGGTNSPITASLSGGVASVTLNWTEVTSFTVTFPNEIPEMGFDNLIINAIPTAVANTGSLLIEGGTDIVSSSELEFDDAEEPDTNITYTLDDLPDNGMLRKNTVALTLGGTFTQDDINNNRIDYVHDGSATTSDSFRVDVNDGQGGIVDDQTFNFTIAPIITWTGTTDNDWHTASNWSIASVPTASQNITIPSGLTNYPTATSAVSFNTMAINSGASFIPQSTATGAVTFNRNLPNANWYLISAPVSGESLDDVISNNTLASNSGGYLGLAYFSNVTGAPWLYEQASSSGNMPNGLGISLKLANPGNLKVSGSLNTSSISIPISSGTRNNFNLLGNPFTAYVNSATFTSDNEALLTEKTIWVWEGTQYETYNTVKPIELAPGQGFFVEASGNSNVTFNTANRSHQSADTFKREAPITNFELSIESDDTKSATEVFYVAGKTTGFDNGYDSKLFSGLTNNFSVYTELVGDKQGEKLAIQTLDKDDTSIISVGVMANAGKEITFSLKGENLGDDVSIYLEDKLTGAFINVSETTYQATITEETQSVGRFYIHTTGASLSTENLNANNISIYKSSFNEITINGLTTEATFKMFSVTGKEVMHTSFTSNGKKEITLPSLAKGVYIVQLTTEAGKVNKKIILE
jgi:hypothetical protein